MASITIRIPNLLLDRVLRAYGTDGLPITLAELTADFTAQIKARLVMIEGEKHKDAQRIEIDNNDWSNP